MTRLFEQKFPIELSSMKPIRQLLQSVLQPIIASNETLGDSLLILTEYVSNLARHQDKSHQTLNLIIDKSAAEITIRVEDSLEYFDRFNYLIEKHRQGKLQAGISGMGIPLMAKLLREYSYEQVSQTLNRFSFNLSRHLSNNQPNVLVVDDDPVLLEVLCGYLEGQYVCHPIKNSEAVFEFLEHQVIDMIISDIEMPGLGGIELRERLSQSTSFRDIPFIFLTGCDQPEIEESAAALNIDDYLEKPVSKARLLNVIQRVLNRTRALRESREYQLDNKHKGTLFKLPDESVSDYRITAHSIHAEHAAGDFMLHHQIGEHHYFLLCDVMGHGYDAGFFSYGYAGYLRAQLRALANPVSAGSFLSQVSDSFLEDELLSHSLVSILVCHLTPEDIELSAAGHPPPMIVSSDSYQTIPVSGPLPGLIPGASYEAYKLNLQHSEKLILLTDGILENINQKDDQAARAAVAESIQRHPFSDAKGWLLALQSGTNRSARKSADDASLLVIERP